MKDTSKNILYKDFKIAVITPSDSFYAISSIGPAASERLKEECGITIEYGKHYMEHDLLGSSSIKSRVEDIHDAFEDKSVDVIICATGGYNSIDLLPHIDWDIIKENSKPFIGSSDITVLLNAIYAKTGLVTYHGPNFYKFGMRLGLEYTLDYFKKALFSAEAYSILPSKQWCEDKWYRDQDNRVFTENEGYVVCNSGTAKGRIVGGNLCSLNLLQGTEYMPSLKDTILFIEEDDLAGESTFGEFYRNFQSLLQQPGAHTIKGLVIGRFLSNSHMTIERINFIMQAIPQLKGIPVIMNVDFGHSEPNITFPVGGMVEIRAQDSAVEIEICIKPDNS